MKKLGLPVRNGMLATAVLLIIYGATVSFVSGWAFMLEQVSQFWYFIVSLSVGFGIQVGLYSFLKQEIHQNHNPRVLAVSGTASTVAMISCCAHYLVNILPVLGAVGIVTVFSQYQVEIFWVGLVFNLFGIFYMINRIHAFSTDNMMKRMRNMKGRQK